MLDSLRKKIDDIDDEILRLLKKRIEVASSLAKIKRESKMPIYQKEREDEVLSRVKKIAEEQGIPEEYALAILREIIRQTRDYETKNDMHTNNRKDK